MARYPIRVPLKHYRGSKEHLRAKAADYNRRAKVLETYVNRSVEEEGDSERCVLLYAWIADDCGLTTEQVREVLFSVDCGHNGLTVYGGPKEKVASSV